MNYISKTTIQVICPVKKNLEGFEWRFEWAKEGTSKHEDAPIRITSWEAKSEENEQSLRDL